MGKNLGPGGKNRRKGKNLSGGMGRREIIWRDEDQLYGRVEKKLGDCRLECICSDNVTRICHIRGKFRKRIWINIGDTVLLSLREFQDEKSDVIHKYTPEEATILKIQGEFNPDKTDPHEENDIEVMDEDEVVTSDIIDLEEV